jgi:simple sugar transport system permease protein
LEVNLSEEKEELQAPETQEQAPEEDERSLTQRIFVRRGKFSALVIPLLAIFTAYVIGGFIIALTSPEVLAAWSNVFQEPMEALRITWQTVWEAYLALFQGAFGQPSLILEGFQIWISSGDPKPLYAALRPFSESLVITTPYIFAGLAVTAGGIWGAIPGFLKARTGAHEVINTIMMNWIAFRLTDYLLAGPMARPDGLPITPLIKPSAYLPTLLPPPVRIHWGFFIALGAAVLVYWFLWKTPRGIEIRMTGANPNAARYAGVRIAFIIVLTMTISGALGGMAGTVQILAVDHQLVRAFSSGYGFDSIALALLGNSHPLGVVLASLLFGFMRGGAARMQSAHSHHPGPGDRLCCRARHHPQSVSPETPQRRGRDRSYAWMGSVSYFEGGLHASHSC